MRNTDYRISRKVPALIWYFAHRVVHDTVHVNVSEIQRAIARTKADKFIHLSVN